MPRFWIACLTLAGFLLMGSSDARADDLFTTLIRGAILKSLPPLQNGAESFSKQSRCVSCHHHSLSEMTIALAQERGFKFDQKQAQAQSQLIYDRFAEMRDLFIKSVKNTKMDATIDAILIDPSISAGYGLAGMAAEKRQPDELLNAMALYLTRKQSEDGRWPVLVSRPPQEGSEFTATALAIRALQVYGPKERQPELAQHILKARTWLTTAHPKTTEDKVFRLFGLRWANADAPTLRKAIDALVDEQRDDGGWAQLPTLSSDAYATGQVMVALHQAGGLSTRDAIYTRGAAFLVGSQKPDGSWFVQKRIHAFQPKMDTGYPHGESQFISYSGACWATMALTLTAPPKTAAQTASQ